MRVPYAFILLLAGVPAFTPGAAHAQTPGVGWEASLSTDFHNVSGIVRILDEDTLEFENFTYDGSGLVVRFYLGATDLPSDFSSGLALGDDLVGPPFDGSQPNFTVDLPTGAMIDGYHAISVWCSVANVSFGSGTFAPLPEPSSVVLCLVVVGCALCRRRRK